MNFLNQISVDPKIMLGKPCIKGTRITVELIIERLSEGETIEELLIAYPHITKENILAALQYTVLILRNDEILPIAS